MSDEGQVEGAEKADHTVCPCGLNNNVHYGFCEEWLDAIDHCIG
jgi:hypothetical protein